MTLPLLAIGVDGALGGWIAAAAFGPATSTGVGPLPLVERSELRLFASDGAATALERLNEWRLELANGHAAPVAVDVPIGLMELGGSRPCGSQCRALLPGKASSVFPPPARFLVEQFDTATVTKEQLRAAIEDRRRAEQAAGRSPSRVPGMSTQSCAVFDKVWETDRFVRRDRLSDGSWPAEAWLFEVHPELCFQRMHDTDRSAVACDENTGAPVAGDWPRLARKSSARGQIQRLALVRRHFTDADVRIRDLEWSGAGSLTDPLDAYAALWTALRVAAHGFDGVKVLGRVAEDGVEPAVPRDQGGIGLLMRMVV